ncbi:MAG: GMC family oxidoreductase [bacterium]|nr:GMC family oxidoreductase [bacterium]
MIKEFQDYTADIVEECDVCIIGSGAGGAVAAKTIAEQGFSVVLLEEGSNYRQKDFSGKPLEGVTKLYRDGGSTVTFGNPVISVTLGKCIGGTTTINSATCFRTPDSILKNWQQDLGLDHLTTENLEPYFSQVEEEISATDLSWDVLGNCAKIIKRGADSLGLNCRPLKHNVKNCVGRGTCQFGCSGEAKQSMDVSYIPKAIEHGARVYANCKVEKLLIANNAAHGVIGALIDPETGKAAHTMTINSKVVIVACGSLITPSFLKRNGVRNRNIGRHLQIHPAGRVTALMEEKVEGWKGVSQGGYIDDFEDEGISLEGIFVHPSLLLSAMPGIGMEHKELAAQFPNIAAFGVMIHDSSTGRVYKGTPSTIAARYSIRKNDMEKFKRALAYTSRIFFAAGAKKVFTGISKMPVLNSMDDVDRLLNLKIRPNHMEILAFHPLGTARMAAQPKDGVVDKTGEVFSVKNLYVADGSTVPTSLGVNPQVTIMTLATLISEGICEKLKK